MVCNADKNCTYEAQYNLDWLAMPINRSYVGITIVGFFKHSNYYLDLRTRKEKKKHNYEYQKCFNFMPDCPIHFQPITTPPNKKQTNKEETVYVIPCFFELAVAHNTKISITPEDWVLAEWKRMKRNGKKNDIKATDEISSYHSFVYWQTPSQNLCYAMIREEG